MASLRAQDLNRPDSTIRYWSGGARGGPVVVFLHGATLDHRGWNPQIEALRPYCRIVAPDLRGHGASTGRFDFDAAVGDIVALLDRLPDRPVALVGLSLGANIAQEVIRRHPPRVQALVAADTTCNTAARHPLAASLSVAAVKSQALMAPDSFAQQAARATALDPQVRQYVLDANADRTITETVDILVSLLTSALRPDPPYRLPIPALLVHGEHDQVGDIASTMRRWAEREPLARYAVIPNAGHASNLDNPGAFTAALTSFLDEFLFTDPAVDDARPYPDRGEPAATGLLPSTGGRPIR